MNNIKQHDVANLMCKIPTISPQQKYNVVETLLDFLKTYYGLFHLPILSVLLGSEINNIDFQNIKTQNLEVRDLQPNPMLCWRSWSIQRNMGGLRTLPGARAHLNPCTRE